MGFENIFGYFQIIFLNGKASVKRLIGGEVVNIIAPHRRLYPYYHYYPSMERTHSITQNGIQKCTIFALWVVEPASARLTRGGGAYIIKEQCSAPGACRRVGRGVFVRFPNFTEGSVCFLKILTLFVLVIFSCLLLSRLVLLLRRLRDGGDGFFRDIFWYLHFLLILASLELTLMLALAYLHFTPGTVNRTAALVALILNGMIAVRAFSTRRILFGLLHLPAILVTALWAFPAAGAWLWGLF